MKTKKHLGTITILLKDRHRASADMQRILTENGSLIMARMGVNPERACVKGCTGLITIVVEGSAKDINSLSRKLNSLYGVVAKSIKITQ